MKKQEFDIAKLSNTILESIVKRLLKEITAEEIHIAVETAILKKKFAEYHKNFSPAARLIYGTMDENILHGMIKRNIIFKETLSYDFNNEDDCKEVHSLIMEYITAQDTDVRDYRKYPELYYNLYSIMPEQTSVDDEVKDIQDNPLMIEEICKQEIVLASQYPEIIERYLSEKIPWIIPFLIIFQIILICIAVKEKIAEVEKFGQKMNVKLQGKEDIFFVESDSAIVYSEPSVHADIVGTVYYSDKVKRIDENNMWDKIIYYDTTGEIHIGWIASKELISYKEWKFNLDK